MKRELPSYVYRQRNGLYFQRRGQKAVKLKCQEPRNPAFLREVADLIAGKPGKPSTQTFRSLIELYRRSPRFRGLRPRTQQDYEKVLDLLARKWGSNDPARLERRHAIAMRDGLASATRFANYSIQVLSVLMEHAIDIGWRKDNPAKGIKSLKSKKPPREPWPPNLITRFRNTEPTGRTRLLFELLFGTGQRIGDVLKMRWSDVTSDGIRVHTSKIGLDLTIPPTGDLEAALGAADRRGMFILTNHDGTGPWSYRGASDAMMKVRRTIGAEAFDIHALRHSAASELRQLGCNEDEIMAVCGMSRATVKRYTATVIQIGMAKQAQKRR